MWIARDNAIVPVAERAGKVVGVGMVTLGGDILLNYVHPKARFDGVSKAILAGLEDALRAQGVKCCRLEITITVHPLYKISGFRSESGSAVISKSL